LLQQCRRLVTTHPESMALLTSRPLPELEIEEAVWAEPLSERDAWSLVSRFSGGRFGIAVPAAGWPDSLLAAIRRPLFAILVGIGLAEHPRQPRSVGSLLSELVQKSLGNHRSEVDGLLRQLAVRSVDNGYASIRIADMGTPQVLEPLLSSTLVVVRNGTVRFALDILTDWFAAQALAEGDIGVDDLCLDTSRMERWRYALAIAVGTFPQDLVSRLLRPVAANHPAFAALVIDNGMCRYSYPGDPSLPAAPPAAQSGASIRCAMGAWGEGLGALASLVGPFDSNGRLLPLGVRSEGVSLTASWNRLESNLPDVSELPEGLSFEAMAKLGWNGIKWARPATVSAWAWGWALSELTGSVRHAIETMELPIIDGPLLDEEVWHQATILTRKGSLREEAFLLETLNELAKPFGPNHRLWHSDGEMYEFAELRAAINTCLLRGEKFLAPPWPVADHPSQRSGRYVWNRYSVARWIERTHAILTAALAIYEKLVESYFPKFCDRLPLAGLMPVRLIGFFLSADPSLDESPPSLLWYFEPLSQDHKNEVSLKSGNDAVQGVHNVNAESIFQLVRRRRPKTSRWLRSGLTRGYLDVLRDRPATRIAYDWLAADLKSVNWLQ
jgi:hypothetical protein